MTITKVYINDGAEPEQSIITSRAKGKAQTERTIVSPAMGTKLVRAKNVYMVRVISAEPVNKVSLEYTYLGKKFTFSQEVVN